MNDQVNWIPPAGGQVVEAKFPPLNPQSQNHQVIQPLYVGVDHNMNHVIKGGALRYSQPVPLAQVINLKEHGYLR
jgi:hypothetical protein